MNDILQFHLGSIQFFSGENALKKLPQLLMGNKPLLVTDEVMIKNDYVIEFMRALKEVPKKIVVFDKVTPNPKDYEVMEAAAIYKEKQCDCVIGLGGGSSMDTAKCVSAMVRHDGDVMDYGRSTLNRKYFVHGREPLVLIPTTSGTGSEVSPHAVITNTEINKKCDVMETLFYADIVILDPIITLTMPEKITKHTGIDALVHMIETYTNKKMLTQDSPFHDAIALEGIRLVSENLRNACFEGDRNMEARTNMLWAGMIGGFMLDLDAANVHGLAGMIQKYRSDMTHGESVGILLPACMEYNRKACPDRFKNIAVAFGVEVNDMNEEEAGKAGIDAVKKLLHDINFKTLLDFEFTEDEIEEFYQEGVGNSCLKNNPIEMTPHDIKQVLNNALKQKW